MAQNISLWGATYSAVPAVNLPKQGGGTARFSDASITTAVESDVASGKIFLKADGSTGTGTSSGGGGGGEITQDANGYLVLSKDGGGGGGGGGMTTGTFTVTAANANTEMYVCFMTLVASNKPAYHSGVDASVSYLPVNVKSKTTGYTARWYIEGDGYMYVPFQGNSDSYYPSVTATSGTATIAANNPLYTTLDNQAVKFTTVWYKVSDGAVLSLSYYNNS